MAFLGALDGAAVAALFRGAALVACPSRWEGMPLVALEAMAAGRAVVASDVDGLPDCITDGASGVLVPAEEPRMLARAIGALLDDPARAARLGAAARTRVAAEFTWPPLAKRYLALLNEARAE